MSRAFYRIRRADWPLMVDDGEGGQVESRADSVALGGTPALLIVQSSIYPNPALEALPSSRFLGNTYAELLQGSIATATQKSNVFQSIFVGTTGGTERGRTSGIPSTASVIKANVIPHAWGAKEGVLEQAAVDALST